MKKVIVSRIIKFTALLVPIAIIVLLLQSHVFVHRNYNIDRIAKFYDEEQYSLDVVFMGASEIFAGFFPGYAYDEYGFTSYLYCIDGNVGSLYKAQLKEILSRQDPQLIVVEVYGFLKTEEQQADSVRLRFFTEGIPLSVNKVDTILRFPYNDKLSVLMPFVKYHADWDSADVQLNRLLDGGVDESAPSLLKGVATQSVMYDGPGDNEETDPAGNQIDAASKEYLTDFLDYCKELKLDNVVFANFPRYIADETCSNLLARVEDVGHIVQQYGYTFIDLQERKDDIGLNYPTDCYNSHHLNIYGQMKLTDYLGDLIINEFHITPMEQTEENKAHWEKCAEYAEAYAALADEAIQNGEGLALLYEEDILALIEERKSR